MSTLSDSSRRNTEKQNESFSIFPLPAWFRQEPVMSLEDAREELEALSYDDQIRIEREKFGMIEYPVEETPELITLALEELGEAILAIPAKKEAYEAMLFIDPEYVESEEFRLPFLRADLFNVTAAAQRIVDYWDHKVQLFGVEKGLKRHISLLDLKEEDYEALKLSGVQLLPRVDEAGRAIIFQQLKYSPRTADSMHRLQWYMVHAAIFDSVRERSTAIQKSGFVYLVMVGDSKPVTSGSDVNSIIGFESWTELRKYCRSSQHHTESVLPMRPPMAAHCFIYNKWAVALVERILDIMGEIYRAKLCFYYNDSCREDASEMVEDDHGEKEANLIALRAYGIDREIIPTEVGGDFDHDAQIFLMDRLQKDLASAGMDLDSDSGWENKLPSSLRELLRI